MSGLLRGGLITRWSHCLPGMVRRHRPVGAKSWSAVRSWRPGRSSPIKVLIILPLFLLFFAPPLSAATYTITGPGNQTVNFTCSDLDNTVNVSGFNAGDVLSGTWTGSWHPIEQQVNRINLDGAVVLRANISDFTHVNKTGAGTGRLETSISLHFFYGQARVEGGTLEVGGGYTLDTNSIWVDTAGVLKTYGLVFSFNFWNYGHVSVCAGSHVTAGYLSIQPGGTLDLQTGGVMVITDLNMPLGAWTLNLQGDITINGGAGTITGDGAVQSLTIG
ncbi:MAG: hypothetical protein KJ621_02090, partial [Proteobacteria bacterium]|nr:hypothetical protein [Pseudomonadota bacterium]